MLSTRKYLGGKKTFQILSCSNAFRAVFTTAAFSLENAGKLY